MALFNTAQGDNNTNQNPQNSRTKSVLRYTMMPEILPRIRALGLHFGHFAYLLALVFSSARLIPATHPVLNAANIGRFGVRQVIAMAANNVTWSMKNIDQIAIFAAIVMGLIMIVIQAGLIAFAALVGFNPAEAQGMGSFFETPDPNNDAAFIFLAQVFGDLDRFWGDNITAPGINTPIQNALYAMLSLYSLAMMVLAVIIVIYYIMTVVGEAAKTGTPFGQRFNSLWAPIRLVIALGLLVPLGSGLNSAQYMTLWIAKMGSGLASQAWILLSDELIKVPADRYIVSDIVQPDYYEIAMDIFRAQVCMHAHNDYNAGSGSLVTLQDVSTGPLDYQKIWASTSGVTVPTHCGGIQLIMEADTPAQNASNNQLTPEVVPVDEIMAAIKPELDILIAFMDPKAKTFAEGFIPVNGTASGLLSDPAVFALEVHNKANESSARIETAIEAVYNGAVSQKVTQILQTNQQQGWLTSGLWYLRIGQIIQDIEGPKNEIVPEVYYGRPDRMNAVGMMVTNPTGVAVNQAEIHVESAMELINNFYTASPPSSSLSTVTNETEVIRAALNGEYVNVACDEVSFFELERLQRMECWMYQLFIPQQLVILRSDEFKVMDPMSMMMKAGNEIIAKSVGSLIVAFGTGAVGGVLKGVGFTTTSVISGFLNAISGFAIIIAFVGLIAGVVLFFLLPVFPFMYFFFAVANWVMEIFEAIIAMPLWALAHLRIDGDGMPGQAAVNGYYLLLAILLRPIMIIFGLVGGYVIFGAGIYLLQHLYDPLLDAVYQRNLWGIEIMVHTIIFTYAAYVLALTCFKLVDNIPNQILRWVGNGTPTFSDGHRDIGDASQGALAGAIASQTLVDTVGKAGAQAGGGIGGAIEKRRSEKEQSEGLQVASQRHSENRADNRNIAEAIRGRDGGDE